MGVGAIATLSLSLCAAVGGILSVCLGRYSVDEWMDG